MKNMQENNNNPVRTVKPLEVGIYSLGEYVKDPQSGHQLKQAERIDQIIQLGIDAEAMGFDVFHLGESHQPNFISQSHLLILAAIAAKTHRIILNTAATILTFSDPVRVWEDLATLDLISKGRMEAVIGKSARVDSFRELGVPLEDYETRFAEMFDLLLQLNHESPVTWSGEYRQPLNQYHAFPRPYGDKESLKLWRGISGTFDSAILAGEQGLPIYVSLIEHDLTYYRQLIDAYRQAFTPQESGISQPQVAVTGLFHVFDSPEDKTKLYNYLNHHFQESFDRQVTPSQMEDISKLEQAHYFGGIDLIFEKIKYQRELLDFDRIAFQVDFGGMPAPEIDRNMQILSQTLLPRLKA